MIVTRIVLLIVKAEREEKKPIVDDEEEEKLPRKLRGPYETKKCNFPFQLKGKQSAIGEGWKLSVQDGRQNHQMSIIIVSTCPKTN